MLFRSVWGIGHYGIVPPERMRDIRKQGSRIWFTTDGMMCLDTPYCAIERLLPHYCFKYDAEAYEFWGIGWLTYDPWKFGYHSYIRQSSIPGEYYYVRYPNGDGYLFYPEVPEVSRIGVDGEKDILQKAILPGKQGMLTSIRFEQAREGVEDFEYLRLLQSLIATSEKVSPGNVKAAKARETLQEMQSLVDCPMDIGRYSTRILPAPQRLEIVREKIARAIESLQNNKP